MATMNFFSNLFKKDGAKELKKLKKEYHVLLEEGYKLQTAGDMDGYARKVEQAEMVSQRIVLLANENSGL